MAFNSLLSIAWLNPLAHTLLQRYSTLHYTLCLWHSDEHSHTLRERTVNKSVKRSEQFSSSQTHLLQLAPLLRELQEHLALARVGAGHQTHRRQRRRRHAERAAAAGGGQEALRGGCAQADRLRRVRRICKPSENNGLYS